MEMKRIKEFLSCIFAVFALISAAYAQGGAGQLNPSYPYQRTFAGAKVIGVYNGVVYGLQFGQSGTVPGYDNFLYSNDQGNTWINTGVSSSQALGNAGSVIQMVFQCNMQFIITNNGKIYRNQLNAWSNWADVSVPNVPANTTGRPDSLASNGLYLYYGNYNGDTNNPGVGAHVYSSPNCGTSWSEVLATNGRHVHAIGADPSNISSIWVSIGDGGYADAGLWHSSSSGSGGSFVRVSGNRYGIDLAFPPQVNGLPGWVLLEGDGSNPSGLFAPPVVMAFDKANLSGSPGILNSTTEGLIWPNSRKTSPTIPGCTQASYWGGSGAGISVTSEGNLFWINSNEGDPCIRTGVWLAQGPDFTSWALLEELTGQITGWEYYKTFEIGPYLFNNIYRIKKPRFVGQ
ncbi:hypothetical protein [Cupriavidus basilensis]|uniref:Exo-alpha-sialidase n=1 Tax=Cupriavidus basilensis TaxID=68895 RepID=A0A643G3L5_9BURK|nr:hypothetical protein [Cupriavidus basilensis]QOT74842.1 hypothetical protein F7R26_011245 [Cupriavidus basilensis]